MELDEFMKTLDLKKLNLESYTLLGSLSGGMNNRSYLIEAKGIKYVVFIPTPGCNDLVSRSDEHYNLNLVNNLEISNKCIYHDEINGYKIMTYLEGTSLDKNGFRPYKEVANVLKKLHSSNIKFKNNYNPFARLEEYERQVKNFNYKVDESYFKVREVLFANKQYLESQKLVPAHNDPQPSNWIKGDKLSIIDFEFAANNDYVYDIACFGNLDFVDAIKLLEEYDGNKQNIKRLYLWRIYQCLQWYNVAINKEISGLSKYMGFDFIKVANNYLELAKKLNAEMRDL